VAPIHSKSVPVILTRAAEVDLWLLADLRKVLELQRRPRLTDCGAWHAENARTALWRAISRLQTALHDDVVGRSTSLLTTISAIVWSAAWKLLRPPEPWR
jgi:hypothetical protein